MDAPLLPRLAAEFLGTFFLVFAGTGAIVVNDHTNAIGHIGISLTFGLVVMMLIYAVGPVSGAHLNPAVSIGLLLAKKLRMVDTTPYLFAQLAGAVLASYLLHMMSIIVVKLGATEPATLTIAGRATVMAWQSFVLEVILTFMLMYTILSVMHSNATVQSLGGIIIGGVIGLEALFAGPISGASMNPARSLAPAFIAARFEYLGIYLVAPTLGAIVAVPIWTCIHQPESTPS
jgi:MIP family channel proteins